MNLTSFANKKFMETVQPLSHDVFNYTKIEALDADLLTEKAVLLIFKFKNSDQKRSRWIPFSQLRKDNNNEIWLSNWIFERIKSDGKND